MLSKRYYSLIERLKHEAVDLKIDLCFSNRFSYNCPCFSSVESRTAFIPSHYLYETTKTAIMISHEMAHIVNHDNLKSYNNDSLELYEQCANVGSLYFVMGNYMSIYDVHEATYDAATQFVRRFHIENDGLILHVKRIAQESINDIPIPKKEIDLLYGMLKRREISRRDFDYMKARLIMNE